MTDTQCGLLVAAVSWSIVVFTFPVSVLVGQVEPKEKHRDHVRVVEPGYSCLCLHNEFSSVIRGTSIHWTGRGRLRSRWDGHEISAIFPEKHRARVMGLWNASIPLGAAMGIALGGIIAERFGWRHAFGIVALPGLLVALLFFGIKDYKNVDLVRTVGGA